MSAEKSILLSLLKLTQAGLVNKKLLPRDAGVPAQTTDQLLKKLSRNDFFHESENVIEASPNQRLRMAVHAVSLGGDFERVCGLLSWSEFEGIAARAFEANGYEVIRNFRFRQASRKWEIDIIGLKKPLILCVDCKHWKRGWRKAAIMKAVEAQIERTKALANSLHNYYKKAKLQGWETATLIPIVMSLVPGPYRFYNDVPIVPVLQLQDFINELPLEVVSLTHLTKKPIRLERNLTDYSK
jgi:Holliday junction resolvase-like predicted endonuclease